MNREYAGLDCWANVVYCCGPCNQARAKRIKEELNEFLKTTPGAYQKIQSWQSRYKAKIKATAKETGSVDSLYKEISACIEKKKQELGLA